MKKFVFVFVVFLVVQAVYSVDFEITEGAVPPDGVYKSLEGTTFVQNSGTRVTTVMNTISINSERHLVILVAGTGSYGSLNIDDTTYMSAYFDDSHIEFYMGDIFMKFTYLPDKDVYRLYFSRVGFDGIVVTVDYEKVGY